MKKFSMQVLKKLWIVVIVVIFLFAGYTFIPSKKVVEENIVLAKLEKDRENTKKEDDILIMAEKGGYLLEPENTKRAFDKSVKNSNVDIIELDIRTTLDGKLVLIEDETINRLALAEDAEPVYVNKTNLTDLQKYNLGENFKSLNGVYTYRGSDRFSAQYLTLMTFESFLSTYKSYASSKLYVLDFQETGEAGQDAVKKAVELLERESYEKFLDSIILSSSDAEMVNWLAKEYSEKYAVSGDGEVTTSLLNACKYGFKIFNNPVYSVVQYEMKEQGLFGIKYNTARKSFVHKIEEKNMALIFRNVNTEEGIKKLHGIGTHVIGTGNHELVHSTISDLSK